MKGVYPHKIGTEASHWAGDEVGYSGIHQWLKREYGQPPTCEQCGITRSNPRSIHWASKNGNHKRDRAYYMRLCVSCHRKLDYRENGVESLKGERHPHAKLKDYQVKEIRKKYVRMVYGFERLAEEFGVTPKAIKHIITRRNWKHI